MRSLVIAIGLLAFVATVDARPRAKTDKREKRAKRDKDARKAKKRIAHAMRHRRIEIRGPIAGQSVGAPWSGRLREAARLEVGDGYFIRRPWRSYGTHATVDFVEHVITDIVDRFPDIHEIAIGDLSAERGGHISEHSSHQSGRDVDIGLIYKQRPPGYPDNFVIGTEDNLDLEVTFVLVEEFAKTAQESGGAQVIFLDFEIQRLLYDWARENGETEDYLATLFQYPHGRGQNMGLVRHEPNHADHIHVRFRCPAADIACR